MIPILHYGAGLAGVAGPAGRAGPAGGSQPSRGWPVRPGRPRLAGGPGGDGFRCGGLPVLGFRAYLLVIRFSAGFAARPVSAFAHRLHPVFGKWPGPGYFAAGGPIETFTARPSSSSRNLARQEDSLSLDTSVAHRSRFYDYQLGGPQSFRRGPGGEVVAGIGPAVHANRVLPARAVHSMEGAGVRQFADIGTGPRSITRGGPAASAPGSHPGSGRRDTPRDRDAPPHSPHRRGSDSVET
jgi:hypothetical protein